MNPLRLATAARSLSPATRFLVALFEATQALESDDARALGARLRANALAAAEGLLAGGTEALAGASRLRELSFAIEIARRLGYLDLGTAAELLAHAAIAAASAG